jgi:integrase
MRSRLKFTKDVISRLTSKTVNKTKFIWDRQMPGFGVSLRPTGSASFVVQYRCGSRQRRLALGAAIPAKLESARDEAWTILTDARKGIDHAAERQIARIKANEAQQCVTVKEVIDDFLKWRVKQKPKSQQEASSYLNKHWQFLHELPIEGDLRSKVVKGIADIAKNNGPIASNRARTYLSTFFKWAMQHGYKMYDGNNPVANTYKAKQKEESRDRVLQKEEIKELWNALDDFDQDFRDVVRLLILTGQRRSEVALMTWQELDLDNAVWTLPKDRSKNGKEHKIYLSISLSS